MEEFISIVIPNYNKEKYIEKCLDSAINQSYCKKEIIVVDDCSNDNSKIILHRYEAVYPDLIKVIFLNMNHGVSYARNLGIKLAKGDFITILDSDDFYYNKNKLLYEMKLLLKHDGDGIAYSYRVIVDKDGNLKSRNENITKYVSGDIFFHLLTEKKANEFVQRDYCMSKTTFNKSGKYIIGMSYYEDYDLLLRLASENKFYFTGQLGTAYRVLESGLSNLNRKKDSMQFRVPQIIRFKFIKKLPISKKVIAYLIWFGESIKLESRIKLRWLKSCLSEGERCESKKR